jgi:hypothetical protein
VLGCCTAFQFWRAPGTSRFFPRFTITCKPCQFFVGKAYSLSFEYESAAEIGRTGSPRTNVDPGGPAREPESQWAEASSEGHGESEPDSRIRICRSSAEPGDAGIQVNSCWTAAGRAGRQRIVQYAGFRQRVGRLGPLSLQVHYRRAGPKKTPSQLNGPGYVRNSSFPQKT